MARIHLPEFIELFVPSRDRRGRPIAAAKQAEWKKRLGDFLLLELKVTGFQESRREGVWRKEERVLREYDPASDRLAVIRERVQVLRTSCHAAQLKAFRSRGEQLLTEMGRALDQEAVAYETREGLEILVLE